MIRLLSDGDAEVFRRIRLEALRAEPGAYASTLEDWESLSDAEWRRRLTENPVFVAFHENDPVGIMGLMRQRASKMAHRASIIMVFLRADLRGTGLARALLEHLTEYARTQGIRQLELAVTAENLQAFRFYQRAGFAEIGRVPGGFLHDGREIDDVMMVLRI